MCMYMYEARTFQVEYREELGGVCTHVHVHVHVYILFKYVY